MTAFVDMRLLFIMSLIMHYDDAKVFFYFTLLSTYNVTRCTLKKKTRTYSHGH